MLSFSTLAGKQKTIPWEKKLQQRRKQEAIKQREREMKAEKEAEAERKKTVSRERKQMAEEKARLEIMAHKVCPTSHNYHLILTSCCFYQQIGLIVPDWTRD